MASYISLLRGINVSGQKKIKMVELKTLYESLGFESVTTYIQTGNVLFNSEETDAESLTSRIEVEITRRFGYQVGVILKTSAEMVQIVRSVPFSSDALYVTFLFGFPRNIPSHEIEKAKGETEEIEILGDVVYIRCPSGYGRTKLSNNFLERKLQVSATTRNWKTVTRLLELTRME